ncbi:ABATE domain-containing protein [Streptomyces sp. NRRL S-87]|uniref:CGNR zinc finger domain-containing protein n=1 Tax=Streptomyces sp. NRRL S-87 TaxID=1463920 RepID=UPI0004C20CE4|nr:CGNR zinc finger domain-containing protein [Streptomyces sp. NRRL S-87]
MERWLALELAGTVRHDGDGGVADDLDTVEGLALWLAGRPELAAAAPAADERLRSEVVALRQAVRALFARAVQPAPPSRADAHRLLPLGEALDRLNAAAAREPVVPRLSWPAEAPPEARLVPVHAAPEAAGPGVPAGATAPGGSGRAVGAAHAADSGAVVAELARAAIAFLSGPRSGQLRSCQAPRCVRYFLQSHGRQAWCKPSCGNRARVARHAERRRSGQPPT